MSCSLYEPLGPVTTENLKGKCLDSAYAFNLPSSCLPSALNISSHPGTSRIILSRQESVTEFKLQRSLVAAWFSIKGTVGAFTIVSVFHSELPASFMWNGDWSTFRISGSYP